MNTKADKMLTAVSAYLKRMEARGGSIQESHPRYRELESSIARTADLLSEVVMIACGPGNDCPDGYVCVNGTCKIIH